MDAPTAVCVILCVLQGDADAILLLTAVSAAGKFRATLWVISYSRDTLETTKIIEN